MDLQVVRRKRPAAELAFGHVVLERLVRGVVVRVDVDGTAAGVSQYPGRLGRRPALVLGKHLLALIIEFQALLDVDGDAALHVLAPADVTDAGFWGRHRVNK